MFKEYCSTYTSNLHDCLIMIKHANIQVATDFIDSVKIRIFPILYQLDGSLHRLSIREQRFLLQSTITSKQLKCIDGLIKEI